MTSGRLAGLIETIACWDSEQVAEFRLVHVRIEGLVQGVGYRAWAESQATQLELSGWVRNRRDGSVEAVFQGPEDCVEEMLRLCRRGPLDARVSCVEVLGEGGGAYDEFVVLPTK